MVILQKNTGALRGVPARRGSGRRDKAQRLVAEARGRLSPPFFLPFCFFRVKTEVYFFDNKSE